MGFLSNGRHKVDKDKGSSACSAPAKPAPFLAPPNVFFEPAPARPPRPNRSSAAASRHPQPQTQRQPCSDPCAALSLSSPQLQPPLVINQHYHFYGSAPAPPPPVPPPRRHPARDEPTHQWQIGKNAVAAISAATFLHDYICSRFDDVMTRIDQEKMCGHEEDLFTYHLDAPEQHASDASQQAQSKISNRGALWKLSSSNVKQTKQAAKNKVKEVQPQPRSHVSFNYFSKVNLYANSKLPPNLPPLALYIATWPIISLAAQYSHLAYSPPVSPLESSCYVSSSPKPMILKSVPVDSSPHHKPVIIFAIRGTGTASFSDWAVNLRSAPASPEGFLDDSGNLCHAGFLEVAKQMIAVVSGRLKALLAGEPRRRRCSLIITGHSAGGAVAALLYCHMLAQSKGAASELNALTSSFKRVHCITFGTPPVSLLPLSRPNAPGLSKSLFLSFINEGDPVARADKAYVKSLLELLASHPPPNPAAPQPATKPYAGNRVHGGARAPGPTWPVPSATFSIAGQPIILRSGTSSPTDKKRNTVSERLDEGVIAVTCRDDQLRGVIWGDPVCHLMSLYAGRVEMLAVSAVTGRKR